MSPFFSIITANRNGLVWLKETAKSILSQTDPDWEWVLVDDGSTEPVREFIESLGDPRIRFIQISNSQGQTKSLNQAIRLSKGKWMVRMDGDDLAHADRLLETRKMIALVNPAGTPIQKALITSDYDVLAEDGTWLTRVEYQAPVTDQFFTYLFEKNNPICHPAVTFYKFRPDGDLYLYNEYLRNAQDYELWIRILADYPEGCEIIGKSLIQYRLVKASLSGAFAKEQKAELEYIQTKKALRSPNSEQRLSADQQIGMYSFRQIYYLLVGNKRVSIFQFFKLANLVVLAANYPTVFFKSFAYYLCIPFSWFIKRAYFRGIYR